MKRILLGVIVVSLGLSGIAVLAEDGAASALLGGANTVFDESEEAFENPLPAFSAAELARFEEGDDLFAREWDRNEGLGPIFNAVSCEGCHIADGRGRPPEFLGETGTGLLVRLAINEQSATGGTVADPHYGGQFQDAAIEQGQAEGNVAIRYQEIQGTYADGTAYTLYQPTYELVNLNNGRLHPELSMSPRLAGQMIGLGLLESLSESSILALADPNDSNGDGISGRANYVWDVAAQSLALGRFGWKANQPNLLQQAAGAFNGDIGMTTSLFPEQSCSGTPLCANLERDNRGHNGGRGEGHHTGGNGGNDGAPRNGGNGNRPERNQQGIEISDEELATVAFYTASLAVPAQRNATEPQVLQGQALFASAQCSACHQPTMETGTNLSIPALSQQTIHPYTDLLLHDMGSGLADGQLDFQASGQEWRTAPLWGIGLLETVNGYAFYLHDGRARTLEEAILWHGGEANASREAFLNMSAAERDALVSFLKSL